MIARVSPNMSAAPPTIFGEGWHVVRAADRGLGWHPQVRKMLVHWLTLCSADGRLPARNIIDRTLLGDLLPYTWMLEVHRAPWRFRYRMAGPAFADFVGQDLTNQWYDEARPHAWSTNRLRLITTARDGMPTWRRGPVPQEDDLFEVRGWNALENLMLPLSDDGIQTDALLGISMPYSPIELWASPPAMAAE